MEKENMGTRKVSNDRGPMGNGCISAMSSSLGEDVYTFRAGKWGEYFLTTLPQELESFMIES